MMWAFVVCDVSFTRLSILAYPSGGAIVRSSHIGGGNGSFHTVGLVVSVSNIDYSCTSVVTDFCDLNIIPASVLGSLDLVYW